MRRKRNVGGGACGTGRDAGSLKETLAVTFIKRIHLIMSAVMRGNDGCEFSSIQNVT